MSRVAIYARKSSESDDKQAKSIEEQLAWASAKCRELGESNPRIYQEARSARRPGRLEFGRLMAAVWKGEVSTIVTWKADRLARNPSDAGNVQQALMEGKTVIVTADRPYAEVDDQFMLNIEFGFSTKYSQDLSKNVRRGLEAKRARGEWAGLAPIGYLNVTGERERRARGGAIVVDSTTAPYVKRLFVMCASGKYSLRALTTIATQEWRLSFRRSLDRRPAGRYPIATIERLLKNPFYYGAMRVKGKLLPGAHEALVSKAVFDEVQRVLAGRRSAMFVQTWRHVFPFSALIVCGACARRFTAFTVRKRSGRTYTYYRCSRGSKGCKQPHVTEREILQVLVPVLKRVTFSVEERDQFIRLLHAMNAEQAEDVVAGLDKLRAEHAGLVRANSHLLDLFIAGQVTKDEKDAKVAEYAERRTALEVQMRETESGQADWIKLAEDILQSLVDAEQIFGVADAAEKRAFLQSLQIKLRATPRELHVQAGNATAMIVQRSGRSVGRALVRKFLTALASDRQESVVVATLRRSRSRPQNDNLPVVLNPFP